MRNAAQDLQLSGSEWQCHLTQANTATATAVAVAATAHAVLPGQGGELETATVVVLQHEPTSMQLHLNGA